MKHYGDICKLDGAKLPVVDCITGGSPCQDLSIAGERAGLAGERSGLFMEQVRIVKEMRDADRRVGRSGRYVRPRFMVWENVPGAFSSNKGEDFGAVLTEIVKIADEKAPDVLMPEAGWPKAGCLYDELGRWSVAWRVHDAQFWGTALCVNGRVLSRGTPQRRKRIAVVADFGGLAAPEVLFERKGLHWDSEESGAEGQGSSDSSAPGASAAISFQERSGKQGGGKGILIQDEHVGALSTLNNQSVLCLEGHVIDRPDKNISNGRGWCEDISYTLNTVDRPAVVLNDNGGHTMDVSEDVTHSLRAQEHGHQPLVYDARGNGDGDVVPTMTGDHQNRVTDYTAICLSVNGGDVAAPLDANYHKGCGEREGVEREAVMESWAIGNGQVDQLGLSDKVGALNCMHDQQAVITYGLNRASFNQGKNAQFDFSILKDAEPTLTSKGPAGVMHNVVRRLTPIECERLQGYPDGWTLIGTPEEVVVKDYEYTYDEDGSETGKTLVGTHKELEYFYVDSDGKKKKCSDAARYKALGNSIALPFWFYLLRRISAQYERPATLGSLFDGIGGFPLCWERCNGKGTAIWASEIEPFCMAVTRWRFREE